MSTELTVLMDVCQRLDAGGVEYMLTGSMALNYYAQPRMTRDVDIVVALASSDVERFKSLFEGDYFVPEVVLSGPKAVTMFNLLHEKSVVKIDFIVRKQETYRRIEFDRRVRVQLPDFQCWIVSREDLILSKLVWAADTRSDFQLKDVRQLLDSTCDREYLDRWSRHLGVDELLREIDDA